MAYITTRRNLALLLTRTLSSSSFSRTRFSPALLKKIQNPLIPDSVKTLTRSQTTGSGYSPLNDPSPNWTNRPPKETILLDGCDYKHWLIVMEFPTDPKPTEEEMINTYVKTLASVLGSEDVAKKSIYSVSTTTYTGFGALISEELSYKVKALPGVLWVLPDSYLDVPNKDYGGDLYEDGKVIHRPQYRYNERQQTRNRPRPRYDRRRETMQVERSETVQRQNWSQDPRPPLQQQQLALSNVQNSTQGGGGDLSINQGQFNQSTW
ncbi:unnamed protein product [Dovyalis caffra]|uniref:MORF/ORRM1/DAG-like MORF domain-containing protein n=1 Tax=Dovyalis caffra TaxID=77055 RepID=A0AAV1RGG6_9ROSI|nr:unnamed protein product [Dovyalis caffra]